MKPHPFAWLVAALAVALLAGESLVVVDEGQLAVRTRFGVVQGAPLGPGLRFAWPFEHVALLDTRVVTLQLPGEPMQSGDQQPLNADLAIDWRVQDPALFLSAAGGDEQRADVQLGDALRGELRAAWAALPLDALLRAPDAGLDGAVRARIGARAAALGLALLDARVVRIDPADTLADAIHRRTRESFEAEARAVQTAADGDEQRIRAEGERNRVQLLAEAGREAQRVRGEGDAQAAALYARAFGRNPEFAAFWRSLAAYRTALGREGDVLVIEPEGDFYKYLRSPARR